MSRLHGWGACALALALVGGQAANAEGVTLRFTCGGGDVSDTPCVRAAQEWAELTGNRVQLVSMPFSGTEQLALYQQLLGSRSPDIDVMTIDSVWPGVLGDHLVDLVGHLPADLTDGQFPRVVDNNVVEGRMVALPAFADVSILYYREDLLEKYDRPVPETWDELTETAVYIQREERAAGNRGMWGYAFQGRSYEGLTVNALEWLLSEGGSNYIDADGRVDVLSAPAERALTRAAGWVGTISPPGTLNYTEEEARAVFQNGNAVFMRNWSYAWALGQNANSAVRGKIGVTLMPRGEGGGHVSGLGGWGLAVSRYSRHPEQAASLVAHLGGYEAQKRAAIERSAMPTFEALYDDPEVLAAVPFMAELREPLANAMPRPASETRTLYPRFTTAVFSRTHRALSGESTADEALQGLNRDLLRISRRGW